LTKPDCQALRELARTGNFNVFLADMAREFGDVVSLSPELYLLVPTRLIKDVLKNHADYRKADSSENFKVLVGEGLFTAEGKTYDQQEKTVKSAFGRKYFAEFRRIIDDEISRSFDEHFSRSKRERASVDVAALSVDMTMAIAARAFFGVGGETEAARKFRKGLVFVQDWFARFQAANFADSMMRHVEARYVRLPFLRSLQRRLFLGAVPGSGEMIRSVAAWKAYVAENEAAARDIAASMRAICADIIAMRRADPRLREKNDVLSSLLRMQGEPGNEWLTDAAIVDQVATFFIAGHETTSDLFITLLWKHARGETPAAVVEELRGADDMIGEEQFLFQRYPATNAYLTEVLLDHAPVPFTVRQANRDLEVEGCFIPKDSQVLLAPFVTRDIDVVFGFGRRQCIGRVFALEEAVIGLRRLIDHPLELADRAQGLEMTQGLTIGYSRSGVPIPARVP
jgi:cytochrome P450